MSDNYLESLHSFAKDIQYISPKDDYIDNKSIITQIKNAWNNSCVLDKYGNIWISETDLHTILRTTKDNAKYYIQQISTQNRFKDSSNDIIYIRGCEIILLIDNRLQRAGAIRKENNLRLSYSFYESIRDSKTARLLRAEYYESIRSCIKNLKKSRIKQFGIKFDELTNMPLVERTCEFSHVRSCSIYPYHMDNIMNGHIVNKETHDIITANSINDENELYSLCDSLNWNISWYKKYVEHFGSLY